MKKNYRFELSLFFCYVVITFIWLFFHEPWRDEAQAWLIARDLNILDIIKQMRIEGSPALWHLLLFPLAKSGLPYFSEFILHWLIAVSAIALFIFYAPFNKYIKALIIFSYFFLFEYVLIARNYNLSMLLLFLIATIYQKRTEKPIVFSILLFLLFNANIHSSALAGLLSISFIFELYHKNKKNLLIPLFIIISAIIILIIQLLPTNTHNALINYSFKGLNPIFSSISDAFMPGYNLGARGGYFFILIFIFILIGFFRNTKMFFILILSISWLFFIFSKINIGHLRHHGLIFLFILFFYWINNENQKNHSVSYYIGYYIFVIFTFFSILSSFNAYKNEYLYNFSGSKEAAIYIKNNIKPQKIIIAYPSFACSSILPFIPNYKFWYADIEKYASFITWNKKFAENAYNLNSGNIIKRANENFGEESEKYYLVTQLINNKNYKLIYKTKRPVFSKLDEIFYIYKRIK